LIAARYGKPPWSTKAFVRTVRETEYHDVLSSDIFADAFPDKHPREWTKQTLITLEEDTEAYMVEVTAEIPLVEVDGEQEYQVSSVEDSRMYQNQLQYLIRWTGYDSLT